MIRIHSSLHKCLTMFYMRVMDTLYNRLRPGSKRYAHYGAVQGLFYNNLHNHKIISANGFAVEIGRLDDEFRIVRFVRDPRDLIVSGYFYHKRGAEPWFRARSPTPEYWQAINGNLPDAMPCGVSYAEYLESLDLEDGLIAEIQFRKHHFDSLRRWPADERIRIFRYEEILGNERAVFREIFTFFELGAFESAAGAWLADRYSMARRGGDPHIRNARPGQWRELFTPRVQAYFDERYADVVEFLKY